MFADEDEIIDDEGPEMDDGGDIEAEVSDEDEDGKVNIDFNETHQYAFMLRKCVKFSLNFILGRSRR